MTKCEDTNEIKQKSLKFITDIKCDFINPYGGESKNLKNQKKFNIFLIIACIILVYLIYWSSNFSSKKI